MTDENDNEIEITPEMIEAGVHAYLSFDSRFEDIEDVVPRIWKAMVAASPSGLAHLSGESVSVLADGEEDISQPALEATITQMQESGDWRTDITPRQGLLYPQDGTYPTRSRLSAVSPEDFAADADPWPDGEGNPRVVTVRGPLLRSEDIVPGAIMIMDEEQPEPEGPATPPVTALNKTVWV